jgi:GDPmannose 4,6-dehydratase
MIIFDRVSKALNVYIGRIALSKCSKRIFNGVNLLKYCKLFSETSNRIYFAGLSEIFGKAEETPQSETTKFDPRSKYGISKVGGFEYVTRKITFTAAKIKLGLAKEICLGNIDAKRDWGFAGDYIKAMHAMLNQETPEDFVVETGKVHSVKEFFKIAFGELRLDYQKFLIIDPKYFRPVDAEILVADTDKARKKLGWQPSIGFEELICKMIRSDYDCLQNLT